MVLPDLETLFELNMESASLLAESKNMSDPFDALIDNRDKGFGVTKLTELFNSVKSFLVPFIQKCRETCRNVKRQNQGLIVTTLCSERADQILGDLLCTCPLLPDWAPR